MKTITVEIKQEHLDSTWWADKEGNAISRAIAEVLGTRLFFIRVGMTELDEKWMCPYNYPDKFTAIHLPAHVYGLWNKLHDGYGLEVGTVFNLQVPDEWVRTE